MSSLKPWEARADGSRASAGDAVDDGAAIDNLGLLSREGSRPRTRADQCLVSADGRFDQGTLAVTGGRLPLHATIPGDRRDVTVPLVGWSGVVGFHGGEPWRDDQVCVRIEACLVALVSIELSRTEWISLSGWAGDDVVHEGKELDAAAAFLVRGSHLARRQVECGKQRRGAVPACSRDCGR